jgi:DNA repair protein RadC
MGRLTTDYFSCGILKPREKAKKNGISSLQDEELLAIVLNTGNKNEDVLSLSSRLIRQRGGLKGVFFSDDLTKEKGIKDAKGYRIQAIKEIMKRIPMEKVTPIKDGNDAYNMTRFHFLSQCVEICVCLFLNQRKEKISDLIFHSDERSRVNVPINTIIKEALNRSASFVLILHNHPSGSLSFSSPDEEMAQELYFKLSMIQVVLLDCLLVTDEHHISMRNLAIGPFSKRNQS